MRRKIALLLAFVMMFSLLPMAVGASTTGITPTANRTGSLWEGGGPANNVRHWNNAVGAQVQLATPRPDAGVIVAREEIVRAYIARNPAVAAAPGGNLRHIMVSADYFVGAGNNYRASLLVQLQNAWGFALAGNNSWTGDWSVAQIEGGIPGIVSATMPGLIAWLNAPAATRGNNLMIPAAAPPITRNDFTLGSWNDLNVTPGAIPPGTPVPTIPNQPSVAVFERHMTRITDADEPGYGSYYIQAPTPVNMNQPLVNTPLFLTQGHDPGLVVIDYTTNNPRLVWAVALTTNPDHAVPGPVSRAALSPSGWWITETGLIVPDASVQPMAGDDTVAMQPGLNVSSLNSTIVNAATGQTLAQEMLNVLGQGQNVLAFGAVGVNQYGETVSGTTLTQNIDTSRPGALDVANWFITALVLEPGTQNQAFLHMWRTGGDNLPAGGFPVTPAQGIGSHFIALPIEYVTNGDTNDNPVHLLFTHHGGWAQAGQAAFRTDLTIVSESTFQITRNGGPRNFHRYGTVLVGGTGRTDGIRIREGAQGAFDQTDWYVEIEIITPGFFWTELSTNILAGQNASPILQWQGNPPVTTRYTTGGAHLGPDGSSGITIWNVARTPDAAANIANRWRTLEFGIRIPNATNLNRLVNDEINIRGLHIAADDRARPGIVEAEVRLYRANVAGGGQNVGFMWQPGEQNPNHPLVGTDGLTPEQVQLAWAQLPVPIPGMAVWVTAVGNTIQGWRQVTPGTPGASAAGNDVMAFTAVPFNQGGGTQMITFSAGAEVQTATVTLANYGNVGLEWFVHENDDAADFVLRSGMQEWLVDETVRIGGQATGHLFGAVEPSSPDTRYHLTARGVLRETVAGSMPGTGASPITFTFNEGIEILGVRMATNEGHFSRETVPEDNRSDMYVWFGPQLESDNFFATTLGRNSVTIRPEIGRNIESRWRNAEITMEFYLSVMPGYEHFFGFDEIEVTAAASVDGTDWEETITIAYAWDPITVETSPVQIDDQGQAVAGIIRNFNVNDVIIHEVEAGALFVGTRLWIGVEGGVSRSWGSADHLSLGSFNVTVEGDDFLELSPPRQDSHGTFVEVLRASRTDGARVVFSDIQMAGNVFPDRDYNVFVADSAVAANWDGFNWINQGGGTNIGFSRGALRGFFPLEPYAEPLFSFAGAEVLLPPPVAVTPPTGTLPPGALVPSATPVTLFQNTPYIIRQGDQAGQAINPSFSLDPVPGNPGNSSAFISVAAIADILGWSLNWDPAGVATFTMPNGNVATFTNQQSTFTSNGQTLSMAHISNGAPAPAYISGDGRMMIHIRAFEMLGVRLNWIPTPGNPGIVVTP